MRVIALIPKRRTTPRPQSWHTLQERRMIVRHGGRPLVKSGTDGVLNGRPVEVRSVRKGKRYRIQKDTHHELVKHKGSYIFVNGRGQSKVVPAARVSKLIGFGKWLKDRVYPHKFVKTKQVW